MVRSYLSPEPLLQSPMYVRQMAQSGLSVPTYAYANNNPLRYSDPTGLSIVIDDSDTAAWANAWRELVAAMNDPEVGFAVSAAYWDPSYTIYVWPSDEGSHLGPRRAGVTRPRENERACDVSINRDLSGRSPDGFPTTFRGTFWHELGHAVFNWRFENQQYVWRNGEAFVPPWVNRATNSEALRFENRTIRGPPWRTTHF